MRIYPAQQRRLLERVGCHVRSAGSRGWRVEPPSWRSDLKIPEDLQEELARLWGYERCPATLPPVARRDPGPGVEDPGYLRKERIRQILVEAGFQEIMTYSLVHPQDHARVKLLGGGLVELENPLSLDQAVMRKTLAIGALQTLARNLHWKTGSSFRFFELGHRYFQKDPDRKERPVEEVTLGLLAAGTPEPDWAIQPVPLGIFHLKGMVEVLLERLWIGPLSQEPGSSVPGPVACFMEGTTVSFRLGGKPLGVAGLVDPKVLASYEIPETLPVAYAELNLEILLAAAAAPLRIQPLPKVPPVVRDLAVVVAPSVSYVQLHQAIREAAGPLLQEVRLVDLYQGPQVPEGKKSICFRLSFLDPDRTLTEEEVAGAVRAAVDRLNSMFQATLR
jgi:phenylalanyl-tRNA synthetase beta chain